ncbi:MAG: phospholipase D-like domain-containing protein, partial [Candidatus Absconditabacteria bacterium]
MTRKQLIFLGYLAGVVGILSWGVASERVQVSWGVSDDQLVYSPTPEEIAVQLGNIQPVTGALWIGPGTLPDFLETLGGVRDHLWLETYDFTEKSVKNLFIKLLNNNVKIDLIMEDKKYQQFQNTRKEIQAYFSGYSGFEIKSDKQMKTEYVHSKFAVWNSGALIQTSNLNKSSFVGNREYIFYTENTGII